MKSLAQAVKELREKTNLGVMDCKKALEQTKGDIERALAILKERGLELSEKKAGRVTSAGSVGAYIHTTGRIGVLIELSCETDFVARNDEFKNLMKELCLQVTASSPTWVDRDAVPPASLEEVRQTILVAHRGEDAAKVEELAKKAVDEFCAARVLLEQPFIRDESTSVKDLVSATIAKLGENIRVKRFARFEIGV